MNVEDAQAIRKLVEDWALWRAAGDRERFATVWHPADGWMSATWYQGLAGFTIEGGLPGLTGEAVERLHAEGSAWLAGSATAGAVR